MENKLVAIHQPNFLPWMGYFEKIARADVFVLLDNAQFPKTGGVWTNRVQMIVNGRPAWLTVPVVRSFHGVRAIMDIYINEQTEWREHILKTIQMNYARAPYFDRIFPLLSKIVNNPESNLAHYNVCSIRALCDVLDLDTNHLVLGSSLATAGTSTDLLISITMSVGGRSYLCGGGANGYQEDENFGRSGVELIYQDFEHPKYPQVNTQSFVSGLSIIDALMNCGEAETRKLIFKFRDQKEVHHEQ